MKPAPFAYADPATVDEALGLLAEHGDDAAVLAGGQSLVPDLNFRRRRPGLVIDLRRVEELTTIVVDDGRVAVGASAAVGALATTHPDAGVASAIARIGHPQIRSRTTVGGSVCQAESAGELPTVLVALGGAVTLRSTRGDRIVAAEEFFVGPRRTVRRPDELVTGVTFGVLGGHSGFAEVSRRPQDLPIVGLFAGVGDDGWTVALGGVAPTPVAAPQCAAALDRGDLAGAVAALHNELDPPSDHLASSAHRRSIAATLLRDVVGSLSSSAAA